MKEINKLLSSNNNLCRYSSYAMPWAEQHVIIQHFPRMFSRNIFLQLSLELHFDINDIKQDLPTERG